jgi:tetratricopeptide (TPR) repeat protein
VSRSPPGAGTDPTEGGISTSSRGRALPPEGLHFGAPPPAHHSLRDRYRLSGRAPTAPDAGAIKVRAQRALRQAAERAAAVGALAEGLALFDRALELTEDERERAAILERAGAVAHRAGDADADAAAGRYRAAGEVHAAAGRARERLGVRAHELRALRYVRAPAELLAPLRELDASLAEEHDALSALASASLAFTLYQCGQHEEALVVASRAIETAEGSGARGELLQARGAQASVLA